jgi:hypothetical protein
LFLKNSDFWSLLLSFPFYPFRLRARSRSI